MTDVSRILDALGQGDPHAARQLLPLVYGELRRLAARKLARETPGQTLDATGLVHEAYVRLVGPADDGRWKDRGHIRRRRRQPRRLRLGPGRRHGDDHAGY